MTTKLDFDAIRAEYDLYNFEDRVIQAYAEARADGDLHWQDLHEAYQGSFRGWTKEEALGRFAKLCLLFNVADEIYDCIDWQKVGSNCLNKYRAVELNRPGEWAVFHKEV